MVSQLYLFLAREERHHIGRSLVGGLDGGVELFPVTDGEDAVQLVAVVLQRDEPNIAEHMGTLNKYSVSITPVIRLDIKEGRVRVIYTVQSYDVLADISGGWLSPTDNAQRTYGDSKRKQDDKTNANLYDEQWEITRHYPFVEKDPQKRTCSKALVMAHAYSNAIIDKVEEALKNGLVGNEDDDW